MYQEPPYIVPDRRDIVLQAEVSDTQGVLDNLPDGYKQGGNIFYKIEQKTRVKAEDMLAVQTQGYESNVKQRQISVLSQIGR
jgi:hypothetical protein